MQGGTATTWHGVTKKEAEKIKTKKISLKKTSQQMSVDLNKVV